MIWKFICSKTRREKVGSVKGELPPSLPFLLIPSVRAHELAHRRKKMVLTTFSGGCTILGLLLGLG